MLFGQIYKRVAKRIVQWENHRYEHDFEDSLINKIFLFEFINYYMSNFIIAFWDRDFGILVQNLLVIMVFK